MSKTIGLTEILKPEEIEAIMDSINPEHYKQDIETVDFMRANAKSEEHFLEFCRLTALGYIARAGRKPDNPIAQEAGKAIWWLTWMTNNDPRS